MTKNEFCKLLEKGRKAIEKADAIMIMIRQRIEESFETLDLSELKSNAENADNVLDAIDCYCQYGEYTPEQTWDEIMNVMKK